MPKRPGSKDRNNDIEKIRKDVDDLAKRVRNCFVQRFEEARERKSLTIAECARRGGLREKQLAKLLSVRKIENPGLRTLVAMARGVGVPLEKLLKTSNL